MNIDRKRYDTTNLPFNEDYSRFAPDYIPEKFTDDEQKYLRPFFSNIDRPVFVTYNLPEEVNAALDSRYSRSTKSKRRLFIDEYVNPIISPEKQKDWEEKSVEERKQSLETRDKFRRFIDFLNTEGGFNDVVNTQRARGFFDKWLAGFGDDSIAEMGGGIHLSCEGISSIVLEEIVSQRIGISPLVKSTRYVQFSETRKDGRYQYQIPGEIKGTDLEDEYCLVMDMLFGAYSLLEHNYLQYIKEKFPRGNDETDGSFERSRAAKRYDDIRDLLPFATLNNVGLSGNGRAYEELANRLLASGLGEARWLGQAICEELETVVPSFVRRPQTERGAEVQLYKSNLNILKSQLAYESKVEGEVRKPKNKWVKLVSSTPDADIEILAGYLVASDTNRTLEEWKDEISLKSKQERADMINRILDERRLGKDVAVRDRDRFKKVPRAFERAMYMCDVWARGGDKRDLERHRMLTKSAGPMTVIWGFDLEREVLESPYALGISETMTAAADLYFKVKEKFGSGVAQYCVPFAFVQHWSMGISAREIYWMGELRTGPQARPHYKQVVLDLVDEVLAKDPSVFQGIMVDRNDYRLARRESEKKIDK